MLRALGWIATVLPLAGHAGDGGELRVAVDIGHTLLAPGATSARGRSEFEFNRELALRIVEALRARGAGVVVVNADGRIPSLQARPAVAAGTDLLLSVHHDSVSAVELRPWTWAGRVLDHNDEFAGHSLFVSRDNPDTARSILCARAIGARLQRLGFVPTHKNGRRRSYADAEHAVHYYDGLAVLRHARMPALLFEAGVIKNRDEELSLRSPQRQVRMADGIATAVIACLLNGRPADDEAAADRPDPPRAVPAERETGGRRALAEDLDVRN
ncbi:MAG: N-acetylmuramoyl-L-alanine amidase [Thauera phenolivorans]|uniref:N-acetylmuramoyl-L-alanine amidase n=1 Tax=Thauera phenolivorans TaxID=1792543 RepID=A0A7X7LVS4_9RHOO|nr:N-acetylmuramoyl-L-alanine amidase [Thauera phenolivorans]NLF54082.1 N-acetylmuramoyl-L-alanine amidase [Thauera phenolivorans]